MLLFECHCGCIFTIKEETVMNERKNYWCQNCTSESVITEWFETAVSEDHERLKILKHLYGKIGVTLNRDTTLKEIHTTLQNLDLTVKQIPDISTDGFNYSSSFKDVTAINCSFARASRFSFNSLVSS